MTAAGAAHRRGSIDIVRVATRLNVGGPARQAILLTEHLARYGFRSRLVAGTEGPREGSLSANGVVRLPTLGRNVAPVGDVRAYRSLRHILTDERPRIVHTHMAKAGALGRMAARRSHVPVVVHTFHGHVLDGYFSGPLTRAFIRVERALARRTDALVAVSPRIRDELLALGIGRPDQWHVIPVGLQLETLLTAEHRAEEARRRLGLPANRPAIGIVGRLVPVKDHETFLRAAARIRAQRPDAVFVIAGDGELRPTLETRARETLTGSVRFLGWIQELDLLYRAMDVVVLTSRNEGTPTALIEAGAAGRPVVASSVGGVPDVVRHGSTGVLVPPSRADRVADEVLDLLADDDRARSMGDVARVWVGTEFSAERLLRRIANLYKDLLARARVDAPSTA